MAATPYSQRNAEFSNKAHRLAQHLIYPAMFGVSPNKLTFESTLLAQGERERVLDGEMAIDRIVKVSVSGLRQPLSFTVQERFRKPEFHRYRDLTITEWNHASNIGSELYKLKAQYFLYGYCNSFDHPASFIEAVAVNVTDMLRCIASGSIPFTKGINGRSRQSFICLKFDAMKRAGILDYHYQPAAAIPIPLKKAA